MTEEEKAAAAAAAAKQEADAKAAADAKAKSDAEPVTRAELNAAWKRLKDTERERDAVQAKLTEIDKASLTETERLKRELDEAKPMLERGKAAIEAVERLVEDEAKALPAATRALLPEDWSPERKLDWIRKANAGGVGVQTSTSTSTRKPNGGGGRNWTRADLANISEADYDKYAAEIQAALVANGGVLPAA